MEILPLHNVILAEACTVQREDVENVFRLDIDSWCYGLSRFSGNLTPKLIHALIREMSGSFLYAVENLYAFSVVRVAQRLHEVSENIVNEKELAFHIIACLPNPSILSPERFAVFEEIIEQVNRVYPDVVQKFQSRLANSRSKAS